MFVERDFGSATFQGRAPEPLRALAVSAAPRVGSLGNVTRGGTGVLGIDLDG
jgi:hypothetical protein